MFEQIVFGMSILHSGAEIFLTLNKSNSMNFLLFRAFVYSRNIMWEKVIVLI